MHGLCTVVTARAPMAVTVSACQCHQQCIHIWCTPPSARARTTRFAATPRCNGKTPHLLQREGMYCCWWYVERLSWGGQEQPLHALTVSAIRSGCRLDEGAASRAMRCGGSGGDCAQPFLHRSRRCFAAPEALSCSDRRASSCQPAHARPRCRCCNPAESAFCLSRSSAVPSEPVEACLHQEQLRNAW